MSFLLSYKVSQNHIEIFFGKILSHGGFTNNPTARQFASVYKRIFVHNGVRDVMRGNCVTLEHVRILTASSNIKTPSYVSTVAIRALNNATMKYRLLVEDGLSYEQKTNDNCYPCHPNFFCNNSIIEKNTISYIAGFVTKRLKENITCETCAGALISEGSKFYYNTEFISIKSSNYSIKICFNCAYDGRKRIQRSCFLYT